MCRLLLAAFLCYKFSIIDCEQYATSVRTYDLLILLLPISGTVHFATPVLARIRVEEAAPKPALDTCPLCQCRS